MYNGIGIQSTRGTGTSGHVQRNIAALRRTHRRRTSNPNPNEKLREAFLKKSGEAQRAHETRRRVEVAVAELEEELGNRGYDDDTIAEMAQRLRKDLLNRCGEEEKGEKDRELEKGRSGSELIEHRNQKLRDVLGVKDDYAEGAGFQNMRTRDEKADGDGSKPQDEAKDTTVEEAAKEDATEKDAAQRDESKQQDTKKPDVAGEGDQETAKAGPAASDTESSVLSESSDESDFDNVPDVRNVPDSVETAGKDPQLNVESEPEPSRKNPSPRRVEPHEEAKYKDGESNSAREPDTPEPPKHEAPASRPQQRSPSRSPPPRGGYEGRDRSFSPSSSSEDHRSESPFRRDRSPRRRDFSPRRRDDLPRSRDMSPYSRDSPLRRAPYPYDQYDTPRYHDDLSFRRSRSPRRTTHRGSPYDKNPTPRAYRSYEPYDYRRSRDARPSYRRRSRSRSRSRSRERYGRYRDDSPDSLSTSSRSPSPYGRGSPRRDRSPFPRRRVSPYGRDSPRRRSPAPYSRKRSYSGYTPPRRVRHRRRSPYGYRRSRRNEREDRDRGYMPSDSDSSRSPPRYHTPPPRSRFSDYPTSRSRTPPRRKRRYSRSP